MSELLKQDQYTGKHIFLEILKVDMELAEIEEALSQTDDFSLEYKALQKAWEEKRQELSAINMREYRRVIFA